MKVSRSVGCWWELQTRHTSEPESVFEHRLFYEDETWIYINLLRILLWYTCFCFCKCYLGLSFLNIWGLGLCNLKKNILINVNLCVYWLSMCYVIYLLYNSQTHKTEKYVASYHIHRRGVNWPTGARMTVFLEPETVTRDCWRSRLTSIVCESIYKCLRCAKWESWFWYTT